jgi:hypothetical protein
MLLDEKDMAKFHQISTKGWNLSPLDEPKSAADQLESGSKEIQLGFPESWIVSLSFTFFFLTYAIQRFDYFSRSLG